MALAWLLQSGTCDVALVGASSLKQFDGNMGSLEFRLSDEEMEELRKISKLPAPYPMSFWNVFCYPDSEFYGGLR